MREDLKDLLSIFLIFSAAKFFAQKCIHENRKNVDGQFVNDKYSQNSPD